MKLKPAALPRLSCRVPPIKNMIRKGKTNAPIRRPRSCKNLSTSREAIAAIAFSSFIWLLGKDLQIGLLERRLPRAQARDWHVETTHQLVHRASTEPNGE